MDSLGATDITIFDNHHTCVALLDSSNTSGLMGYNTGYYQNTINWSGAVSTEDYYALVFFKSAKGSGYNMVTKWIYPDVARRFRTNCNAVERSLRTVANTAWDLHPEVLSDFAGKELRAKPTASPTAKRNEMAHPTF